MKRQSIKILSLESKDIYGAMNPSGSSPKGYNIRDKEGNISLRKFENTLDWSLDTMKMQEEYERAARKHDFYFVVNKRRYTQVVINVKFSYSYKEFNKSGKNTFVRAGYDFRDCVFTDGVCIRDGVLIGIQTNVEVQSPVPEGVLPSYFAYVDGCYHQTGTIPVLKNKAELRQELYKNGFVCDGIKYVRYKRSAGSSRVGKCLFVNELIAKRMARWDRCGLTVRDDVAIDLAAYESYIALPMSSIIDTIIIEPESILIVDDYASLSPQETLQLKLPYIHTTLLVNELINLEYESKNSVIRVKEKAGMRKDRYSSLSYNIFVAKQIEREAALSSKNATDSVVFNFKAPRISRNHRGGR